MSNMKTTDILYNLPIGEVIPKRVLAVLKRAGVLYDYDFGYTLSYKVWHKDMWEGK